MMYFMQRWIFVPHDRSADTYDAAMQASNDLLQKIRESRASIARSIAADIWRHANNMPFMATVYESVQEMKSGTEQKPTTFEKRSRA